jgi:cellulose synthase/poly-beta-1,6-N-acetylglucosamine synthase-like glycosyltransferase/peptidoglycan/xylan/chitin deacetylase (PgdA/CDA1 family)
MHYKHDGPVFFDRGGKRWQRIRFALITLALLVIVSASLLIPAMLRPTKQASFQASQLSQSQNLGYVPDNTSKLSPEQLASQINQSNVPVIGAGPLVRVVHVQKAGDGQEIGVPIYSNQGAEALTNSEVQAVGSHDFAIEYYGQTSGKQIALTFDDGPDPTYTPKILDELSKNHVQASFFEIGKEVVKYPAITKRVASEGHVIGDHTFNHVDFDFVGSDRGIQEINQTQRVIQAASGYQTSFLRLPYAGNDPQSLRDNTLGLLKSQQAGYVMASYTFDSNDWQFPKGYKQTLPTLNGQSQVILMHDGGGDRSRTLPYLQKVINEAKSQGYTFVTLNQMYENQSPELFTPVKPSIADRASLLVARMYLVWPHAIVAQLFIVTIAILLATLFINIVLASLQIRRAKRSYTRRTAGYTPLVSVIVPAFNEEKVIAGTISSILRSNYRKLEVIVVDDGSKDNTQKIARKSAARSSRVRVFRISGGGKSAAVNHGIWRAKGEIIVGIDADTVFTPSTLGKLVRHFADEEVGAVSGSVKVGNITNALTRWQSLDYIIGIHIERSAQAFLNAIMIVPGACGAWRKSAIKAAGGYSNHTLAEDFDLTLSVHQAGYKVLQDNDAIAYTESPLDLRSLVKQRFRWIFGNTQTFWKHRDMIFRRKYGWLGMYVLPTAIFNLIVPILFVPVVMLVEIENVLGGNYLVILIFFSATILLQLVTALAGIILARERLSHLLAIPVTRFIYSPMRSFLLYRSVLRAAKGSHVGWNKLQRSGTVHSGYQQSPALATPLAVPAVAATSTSRLPSISIKIVKDKED